MPTDGNTIRCCYCEFRAQEHQGVFQCHSPLIIRPFVPVVQCHSRNRGRVTGKVNPDIAIALEDTGYACILLSTDETTDLFHRRNAHIYSIWKTGFFQTFLTPA
jgi:hypothetical protein